jgi:hypothetical protein
MLEDGHLPDITVVDKDQEHYFRSLYKRIVQKILLEIVPVNFFERKDFEAALPIFKSNTCDHPIGTVTFFIFGKYQKHTLKFLIDMLSNWLIPGRRLNLTRVFSSEFCIPSCGSSIYLACEILIQTQSQADINQINTTLSILESEIRLGMESPFYAKRILEVKGLTTDAKTALIQENIAHLIERKPHYFDFNILTEMQHILVICRDEFKSQRSSRHLSRIIGIKYLFRKSLAAKLQAANKRHLFLKIFRTELQVQNQRKNVLGIIVGFNFLREKEVFEKRHLMRAIQNHVPNAVMVENSYFDDSRSPEPFCTMYLEIEKSSGEKFNQEEILRLRQALPIELIDGIEQLMHTVFMPRNEEEVMRNILSLSSEVKYLRDLPQVMINFDEQTYSKLIFTIIIVRVLKPGGDSIAELFLKGETFMDFVHDRCKTVGYLRSKYIKEATVFRLKIKKEDFIRRDHSIDLNKARQAVVFELLRIIGEFRDFNGGMILKQNQLLSQVKSLMADEATFNELLFENFFFSVTPIVMRTVLEPEALKKLFLMLQETLTTVPKNGKNYLLHTSKEPSFMFVVVKSEDSFNLDEMTRALAVMQPKSSEIAQAYVKVHDHNYNGYIFRCTDPLRQEQFGSIIHQTVEYMFDRQTVALDKFEISIRYQG